MQHTSIRLPAGRLTPFGPSVALDRAVMASALHANPRAGEALALAAQVALYFRQHRDVIEGFAALANDLSDMIDGDPDFEDATNAEDDFALAALALPLNEPGPGCEIGDAGEHDGSECDSSYPEWQTLKPYQRTAASMPVDTHSEDDELAGDETDGNGAEDEEGSHTAYGSGPGCVISDPDAEHDGREIDDGH